MRLMRHARQPTHYTVLLSQSLESDFSFMALDPRPVMITITSHATPHTSDPIDADRFYAALGKFTVAWGRFEGFGKTRGPLPTRASRVGVSLLSLANHHLSARVKRTPPDARVAAGGAVNRNKRGGAVG
jgi:hypothetical protein